MIKILILTTLFLVSCATSDIIPKNPTGQDELDIYLQNWVTEFPNITACVRIVDDEYSIKSYLCAETETDRRFDIPIAEWEKNNLGDLFIRVSKEDLRTFLSQNKNIKNEICKKLKCDENKEYSGMEELKDYEHVK